MTVMVVVIMNHYQINENNDNRKYYRSQETPHTTADVFKLKQGLARLRATHMMVSIRALCIPTEPANCFFSAYTVDGPPACYIIQYGSGKMQGKTGTKYYQCHIPIMVQFFVFMTAIEV